MAGIPEGAKAEAIAAEPGSPEEHRAFQALQGRLPELFRRVFPDPAAPRTVVVVPSLSLDPQVMAQIPGVPHYEERMLCMLLLLRLPCTRLVYVTSQPLAPTIVDYYLHLLPGVPRGHAIRRLELFCCHDGSPQALTAKILARPRLLARLRAAIADPGTAHMTCFTVSPLERTLALRLGVPIYGCDPALLPLGSKSGSRKLFKEAGIPLAAGFEDLGGEEEVAEALAALKAAEPGLRRAVVKLNDGFSGDGNAVLDFSGAPKGPALMGWVRARLPALAFAAPGMRWEVYREKLRAMGGVVEAFLEGARKRSPSAQYRVDPLGGLEVISTHDQVLGGRSGQVFLGCRFPADRAYRGAIQAAGLAVARLLQDRGVLGRFGIDFLVVRDATGWRAYAVEVNLRKGGTTHPFLMLQFLTDGHYDAASGVYRTPQGRPCCYEASDNLQAARYAGLSPEDLIHIAVRHGLHFHSTTQEGVVFHLIGALSEFGKLGLVCVAGTARRAARLYRDTVAVLDRETG
jgi:hypothetical protein